jgi:hypothetical protein
MNSNGGGSIPLPNLRTQHVFGPMRLSREPLRGWYPRVAIDFVLSHLDMRGYRRFFGAAALPGARELSPTDDSLRLDPDGCLMRMGLPI